MKKLLALAVFVALLSACGSGDTSSSGDEAENEGATSSAAESESQGATDKEQSENSKGTLSSAKAGDTVKWNDTGEFHFKKIATLDKSQYTTGPIEFKIHNIALATFTPINDDADVYEKEEITTAVVTLSSENTSEDTVSFHPFSTATTTNTKGQYDVHTYIHEGNSEHIGKVTQDHMIAFDLEDEKINDITEMTFVFDAPAVDAMSQGKKVKVSASFK